jgi:PKD repeat protein
VFQRLTAVAVVLDSLASLRRRTSGVGVLKMAMKLVLVVSVVAAPLAVQSSPAGAIADGTIVAQDEAPDWVVYLRDPSGFFGDQSCTGSLIAPFYVLTAAHCVTKAAVGNGDKYRYSDDVDRYVPVSFEIVHPTDWLVVAGRADLDSSDGFERNIREIHLHPRFVPYRSLSDDAVKCDWFDFDRSCRTVVGEENTFDFAILELSEAAPAGTDLVSLASERPALGSAPQFYGFGTVSEGRASRELRRIPDGSYELADCGTERADLICARSTGSTDVRSGDSGGPWLNQAGHQYAVTSFGRTGFEFNMFVGAALPWVEQVSGVTPPGDEGERDLATALIVDSSGSMGWNDPTDRRIDAGKAFVAASTSSDLVGVVDFDSFGRIWSEGVNAVSEADVLGTALDRIDSTGGTNIGVGLSLGCEVVTRAAARSGAAILLTDGQGAFASEDDCFVDEGWPVYTFGLSSGADADLLQDIADRTGGRYKSLDDVSNIACEFQQVRNALAGTETSSCEPTGFIELGEAVISTFEVVRRLRQVTFTNTWPGSDIEMTLTSPSGREIDRGTLDPNVTIEVSGTLETITVRIPEPGAWSVELLGTDIPVGGEPYTFSTVEIPIENDPPVPQASLQMSDVPLGVDFTAVGSADPDGEIVDYQWDFGDGYAAQGVTAAHAYMRPGNYTATLTVLDNSLESATTAFAVTVTGPGIPCPNDPTPFVDVAALSFAAGDVRCVFGLGITTGTTPTTFDPGGFVTREQMAAFLGRTIRALGGTCSTSSTPLADVNTSSFAASDVRCIYGLGITTGTTPTTFDPGGFVTREQMAAFLGRTIRSLGGLCPPASTSFVDVPASSFAVGDVGCIFGLGITTGTTPTTFAPGEFVTREQMAAFLARVVRAL